MNCAVCNKPCVGETCSAACLLRYRKGVRYVAGTITSPTAPLKKQLKDAIKLDWTDTYEQCDGCDGVNCKSGFVPNWVRMGKTKESLIKEKKSIIKKR